MLTIVKDNTHYSEVNFLYKKFDARRLIKGFCEKVNTQTQRYPRSLHTDQGGEFINGDLKVYFKGKGITQQHTAVYSHKCNGIAERYTQTLSALRRTALTHAPPSLWGEEIGRAHV